MAQRSSEELLADWSSEAVLYDREVEEAIREVRRQRAELLTRDIYIPGTHL